jgi:formylglycine-generating enzyme required for sulfatase activity
MIERFIALLQDQGLILSDRAIESFSELHSLLQDEDIADTLWLAAKMGGAYEDVNPNPKPETTDEDAAIQVIDDRTPAEPLGNFASVSIPEPKPSETTAVEKPEKGLPIQIQAAPALPNPRYIGRSLRSLMRKVPSLTRLELDELATVNCIAEHDIWFPILKPAPERWFDLELVIEASQFSFIWQDTLAEFRHLLESQGAFRNVRTWSVEGAETGQPRLVAKKQMADTDQMQPTRSHKELVDASGRRLVLFVSDCRSLLWQQGKIHDWLALWSRHGPTAIVQLLPERLWPQSELDAGFAVQVGSLIPGTPNHNLQVRELPARTKISPVDTLTLPVVTLTASALKQWALVVAAAGRQRSPARLFDLSWVKNSERDRSSSVIYPELPEARVELFNATASPLARQLAGMMAAVPVDLSVVHLIQQELLPQLTPVHVAEVYTSGLLKEVETSPSQPGDVAQYVFVDGVRGLLNEATPLDETIGVIEALSQRIARTLGFEIRSFTALLSPKSSWSQEEREAILPFAQVATEVLHRLGGDYSELADFVEQDAKRRSDWIKPVSDNGTITRFPDLETLNFFQGQLIDPDLEDLQPSSAFPPPLKAASFQVATISLPQQALEIFEFETAKIECERTGILRRSQCFVQKSRAQAQRFVELLANDLTLEMVAIRGGHFLMGSPENELERSTDEGPQHEVALSQFFLAKFPITQAQWRAVAAMPQVNRELKADPSNFKGDLLPIEQVSWYEAVEFCDRLTLHTNRQYRLPTEVEWEYACRAGTTTPFHFGETITTDLANYCGEDQMIEKTEYPGFYGSGPNGEYRQKTTSVDQFDVANAFGLCDMHGNVWEWCQDHWHENYENTPTEGSAWLTDDEEARRILRGGSWINNPRICRSAYRINYAPNNCYYNVGFRVSCSALRT